MKTKTKLIITIIILSLLLIVSLYRTNELIKERPENTYYNAESKELYRSKFQRHADDLLVKEVGCNNTMYIIQEDRVEESFCELINTLKEEYK